MLNGKRSLLKAQEPDSYIQPVYTMDSIGKMITVSVQTTIHPNNISLSQIWTSLACLYHNPNLNPSFTIL